MHLLNMDHSSWYSNKEIYNSNFISYYNTPYQYNKSMMPYMDQGSCHINQQYYTVPNEHESVIENGQVNPYVEKENENSASPSKKRALKSVDSKRIKSINKREKETDKNKTSLGLLLKAAPCRGQIKHSDCDKVSDEDRKLINKEFQELGSCQSKWQFIASHIYVHAKNKSTSKGPSRRENTHQYFLTVGGQSLKVCRKFFLATLNVSEAVIRTSLEKLSPQGICQEDNRGRKAPPNKLSESEEEFLRQHILSFTSGYGKGKTKKGSLDSSLSIASMHKLYVKLCKNQNKKPVSVETYRRVCKNYNMYIKKSQEESNKTTELEHLQKVNIENSDTSHLFLKPYDQIGGDTRFDNNYTTLKPSSPNDFSLTSYLVGMETTRELGERSSPYLLPFESRSLSPIEPQHSFCQDFQSDSSQSNVVIEIGAMSRSAEKDLSQGDEMSSACKQESTSDNPKRSSKLKRLRGESYMDSKGVLRPARPMKPAPCRNQSKHARCDTVTDQDRALIYREFRNLPSNQAQWQFIASHVYVHAKSKSTSLGPSRRENTHHYYLTVSGQTVKVCRKFFLATLNVSEAMIRTALEKLSPQGICQNDNRGRKQPPNKLSALDEEFLRRHILSFRSVDSRLYGKKNHKRYLDSNLSFSFMHKMYVSLCKEQDKKFVSIETYRRISKEYNIAFMKPQKDSKKGLTIPQWPKQKVKDHGFPPFRENETVMSQDLVVTPTYTPKPTISEPQESLDFDLQSLLYIPE